MTIKINAQGNQPTKIRLTADRNAGHADHWFILTDNMPKDVPTWLQQMINNAIMPNGLQKDGFQPTEYLLIGENADAHIKQVLAIKDGKPQQLLTAFPCINSPYGTECTIERVVICEETTDAVLRLRSKDGSILYAYDQLYSVNHPVYEQNVSYFVNFSAWAYNITSSKQDEVILVEDQQAIRYHRAFNDIIAQHNGEVPDNIQELIQEWQPDTDEPLAPVEINLGNMCAYLFGDTLGQEDEAWCQGQVLGKQTSTFYGKDIILFDVVILREPDADPLVVRIGALSNETTQAIEVHDYIQANIWLQAAIYAETQSV